MIIKVILSIAIIFGGVALWTFGGVGRAIEAQRDIDRNGYYYNGEAFMSPSQYQTLKASLSLRDGSLKTSKDLIILPETNDGKFLVKYSFFSSQMYENLNRTKEFPTERRRDFHWIPLIYPIIYVLIVILFAVKVLG